MCRAIIYLSYIAPEKIQLDYRASEDKLNVSRSKRREKEMLLKQRERIEAVKSGRDPFLLTTSEFRGRSHASRSLDQCADIEHERSRQEDVEHVTTFFLSFSQINFFQLCFIFSIFFFTTAHSIKTLAFLLIIVLVLISSPHR